MNKESVQAVDGGGTLQIPEITDLVPECIKSCQKDLRCLVVELMEGNMEKVANIGHNIAGTGAVCGFEFIYKMGQEIERSARQQNQNNIKKHAADLISYLSHVELMLRDKKKGNCR